MNNQITSDPELEATVSRIIERHRKEAYLTIEGMTQRALEEVGHVLKGKTAMLSKKAINGISSQTLKYIADMIGNGRSLEEAGKARNRAYMLEFIKARSLTFEATRLKYPNYLKPWKEEDDQELERLWGEGVSVNDLAVIFMRNPGAIKSRIEKLELAEKYGE